MTTTDAPPPPDPLWWATTDPGPWLSCDDCFRLVDRYVEALIGAAGGAVDAAVARMPAHLSGCSACAEEATTLVLLAATDAGIDPAPALQRLALT
jgi:hypothetical protein